MAWLASCYYAVACCNKKDYPNYRHHRIYNLRYYIKLWVTSGIKRIWYLWKDRQFAKQVKQLKFGDFIFCHCKFTMIVKSEFIAILRV